MSNIGYVTVPISNGKAGRACYICKGFIDKYDANKICKECRDKITLLMNPKCSICGKNIEVGETLCKECTNKLKELL